MKNKESSQNIITFEDIVAIPSPGNSYPDNFSFSPDGKHAVFLYSPHKDIIRFLWYINTETFEKQKLFESTTISEDELSPEEKLRRERQRQIQLGVTDIQWSKKTNRMIFKDSNGIYGIDFDRNLEIYQIINSSDKSVIDPQISPDGNWIAYVEDDEVFITSFDRNTTKQITYDAKKKGVVHGVAEYFAQEEMGRLNGYWWSPDSEHIAFTEVDERHIPVLIITHHSGEKKSEKNDLIHYPYAGERNAIVKLFVVDTKSLRTTEMNLGKNEDIYLTRVNWFTEKILTAQIENREQTTLDLIRFDIDTGNSSLLMQEKNDIWINLHKLLTVLNSEKYHEQFIWASERTGFQHLYLYDFKGNILRTLTQGEYKIEEIVGINEESGLIYVLSTAEGPTERHLFAVSIDEERIEKITKEPGIHNIVMNNNCNQYFDTFSSIDHPPQVNLNTVKNTKLLCKVHDEVDPIIDELQLKPPKIINLTLPDETTLYGAIYQPDKEFGSGPFPTIVYVYGGPHPQLVSNNWLMTSNLRLQNLRNKGFLVFIVDNRGSGRRGLKFESVLKHQFGKYEVEDQVFGIKWLISEGLADKERIGIFGWSYGGYMSLMCLSKAPEIFKAAFAGAPTNDMRDYDTYYTERYLGKPQNNEEGYNLTCVSNQIQHMKGKLLIAHGLIDENVHFRHTAKLISSLIKFQKDYSILLFPDGRH